MPTPIGHALAGVAAGWAVAGAPMTGRALIVQTATLALLGGAADLDLFWGRHRAETHSLGAAAIVGLLAAWRMWPLASTRLRVGLAAFAAWASHPLADSLALDGGDPIGLMAFWPLSTEYVQTGLSVFAPVRRSLATPGLVLHNLLALAREVAILGPLAWAVWIWRGRVPGARAPR